MYSKNIFNLTLILILLLIGCDDIVSKSNDRYSNYDDALIEKIQNATNKVEIGINELPADAQVTIEQSYMSEIFLSELLASGLGYELTIGNFDTDETEFHKIYFNLEGRKLESKIDHDKRDWKCFDFVYPVTFTMPDGSNITITDREDWEELKNWYEENPDSEARPTLQYPVDILYEDDTTLTINNDEEMREAKGTCDPQCFDLVYPVTFIMPDGSIITITSDEEEGWEELKDWYEENPDSEERPNFQYPIDIIYEDGTTGTINNEDEMDAIKENCE